MNIIFNISSFLVFFGIMISKLNSFLLKNNQKFLISINQRWFAQQPRENQKGSVKDNIPKTDLDPRDILNRNRNDPDSNIGDNKSSWADMNKDYNQSFNTRSGTTQGFGPERKLEKIQLKESEGYEKQFERQESNVKTQKEQGIPEKIESMEKAIYEKMQTGEVKTEEISTKETDKIAKFTDDFGKNEELRKIRDRYKEEFDAIYEATGNRTIDSNRIDLLWNDIIELYGQEELFVKKSVEARKHEIDPGRYYAEAIRESLDTRANWLYATMWQILRDLRVDPMSWRNNEYHVRYGQKYDDYSHRLQLRMVKPCFVEEVSKIKTKLSPIEEAIQAYKEKIAHLIASAKELGLIDQIPQMKKKLLKDIKKRYNLHSDDITKIIESIPK